MENTRTEKWGGLVSLVINLIKDDIGHDEYGVREFRSPGIMQIFSFCILAALCCIGMAIIFLPPSWALGIDWLILAVSILFLLAFLTVVLPIARRHWFVKNWMIRYPVLYMILAVLIGVKILFFY